MKCPHCKYEVPDKPPWGDDAKKGTLYLCLECGGYSAFITKNRIRPLTQSEFQEIRNKPDILLAGRIREYFFRLHSKS